MDIIEQKNIDMGNDALDDELIDKIIKALDDDDYEARTISGLAKAVERPPSVVVTMLNTNLKLKQQVKLYPRRSKSGEMLVTTRSKFDKFASFKDKFIDVFATNRGIIDEH